MTYARYAWTAAALLGASMTLALAQPAPPPQQQPPKRCFYPTEFRNWKAPNPSTIFIRVNLNEFYRLDVSGTCPALMWPDSHLVTVFRGPDIICSALDWDMKVSQSGPGNIPEPCIIKNMTPMTPAEVAAIPPRYKP